MLLCYGHTKSFCNRVPRCVKCPELHLTSECIRRGTNSDVSYVLCTGNHPANYKGCTVYKQLQQKSFPTLRRREPNHPSTQPQAQIEENQTYAEAARIVITSELVETCVIHRIATLITAMPLTRSKPLQIKMKLYRSSNP